MSSSAELSTKCRIHLQIHLLINMPVCLMTLKFKISLYKVINITLSFHHVFPLSLCLHCLSSCPRCPFPQLHPAISQSANPSPISQMSMFPVFLYFRSPSFPIWLIFQTSDFLLLEDPCNRVYLVLQSYTCVTV